VLLVYCYNKPIIKIFLIKYKKIILVILAVLFLVALFVIKKTSLFKNIEIFQQTNLDSGLTYNDNVTIEDLVTKDTDNDGVLDWQESLYGLDPNKKETTPGMPDSSAINKLKTENGNAPETIETTYQNNSSTNTTKVAETEPLTQTEKFSREVFTTVVAVNQNGTVDPATINAIGASLAEKIKNPVVRKVFLISDIKIINDDSAQALQTYVDSIISLDTKYPINENVLGVLEKFVADQDNIDPSVLKELDPAIDQMQNIINAILKINIPQSISLSHLQVLNDGERVFENISDMQFFESDPIIALGAMSKFVENVDAFQKSVVAMIITISKSGILISL
jgi:hypothetical protein